jgi:hypothetical protein
MLRNYKSSLGIGTNKTGQRLDTETSIKIGTWDVRILNKPRALQCILNAIKNYNISILALKEVRWPGEGSLRKNDKTNFYS